MFLALLGDVSLLTITSQHRAHQSQNTLSTYRGKIISRLAPTPARQAVAFRNHGTCISVRNLFGNLPVRVKQRALKGEEQNAWYHEWEELKFEVVSLLLGWPFPIQVSLLDSRKAHKQVFRRKGHLANRVLAQGHEVRQPLDISQVLALLKDGGYIQQPLRDSWQSLSASTSSMMINSAISLNPVPTKRIQFISLGILPLSSHGRASLLYETINTIFSQSHFGIEEEDIGRDEAKQEKGVAVQRSNVSPAARQLKRGHRGIDRWPVFFIQILLKEQDGSLCKGSTIGALEDDLTLTAISNILRAMFVAFLDQHHLHQKSSMVRLGRLDSNANKVVDNPGSVELSTSTSKQLPHRGSQSSMRLSITSIESKNTSRELLPPITKSSKGSSNAFSKWSRIKSGRSDFFTNDYLHTQEEKTPCRNRNDGQFLSKDDQLTSDEAQISKSLNSRSELSNLRDDQPKAGTRLDQEAQPLLHAPLQSESRIVLASYTSELLQKQLKDNLRMKRSTTTYTKTGSSSWVRSFLEKWDNPVFAPTEQPIPQAANFSSVGQDSTEDLVQCHAHSSIDGLSSDHSTTRLSKSALKTAEVIAQVDRKFILLKMKQDTDSTLTSSLVLIDQHAADERCRIEDLLSELCAPIVGSTSGQSESICPIQTFPLDAPLNVQITLQESRLFESQAPHFRIWGITYDLSKGPLDSVTGNETQKSVRLTVRSVPSGIAERCKAEPKRLFELLRAEIWKGHEHIGHPRHLSMESFGEKGFPSEQSWLERIGSCPQGILEMLVSRSCRSGFPLDFPCN